MTVVLTSLSLCVRVSDLAVCVADGGFVAVDGVARLVCAGCADAPSAAAKGGDAAAEADKAKGKAAPAKAAPVKGTGASGTVLLSVCAAVSLSLALSLCV